jgi:hypothetical protein
MSFQETLTSLLNIVLLSTGNKATTAVIHELYFHDVDMPRSDLSYHETTYTFSNV